MLEDESYELVDDHEEDEKEATGREVKEENYNSNRPR